MTFTYMYQMSPELIKLLDQATAVVFLLGVGICITKIIIAAIESDK